MFVKHRWLKISRLVHLYLGVFTAPAMLFFAITGGLQTFGLHERERDGSYTPPTWLAETAQLHKKQILVLPERKLGPGVASKGGAAKTAPSQPPRRKGPLPMKIFFALVSMSLLISVISGIYMAYRYARRPRVVSLLLLAGVAVPLALLLF